MKVYFHLNLNGFTNCYLVVNEKAQEAILIDPGDIGEEIISQIENQNLKLSAVFITHNHKNHVHGLQTLMKIYSPKIFAADWEVAKNDTSVLSGDGTIKIAKMVIHYMSLPGHTSDSMIYKIGNILFTGDVLGAGSIGSTNSSYSEFILKSNIERKIFSQQDSLIVMPGHGPITSLGAAKNFNKHFITPGTSQF